MLIVALPRRFYGGMIGAFRVDHKEWEGSEDLTIRYDKKQHDYLIYLRSSAISAITTWATVSASSHITTSGGALWAELVLWRAKQPVSPLEPASPVFTKTAAVLPGQLPLFQ